MKLGQDFDKLIATYNQLLKQCHDLLAADADQAERDKLRASLAKFISRDAGNKAGADSSGGSE